MPNDMAEHDALLWLLGMIVLFCVGGMILIELLLARKQDRWLADLEGRYPVPHLQESEAAAISAQDKLAVQWRIDNAQRQREHDQAAHHP